MMRASKRKSRTKAIPVLGAAGLLSLAGGASAATVPAANLPLQGIAPGHEIILGDEEISDVSLATFYIFDKENAAEHGSNIQLAAKGGGCGGKGGGCGGKGGGCGGKGGGCGGKGGGCGGKGGGGAHGCAGHGCGGRGCGGRGCGLGGCGCWGGCGCGCCISWGGCGFC